MEGGTAMYTYEVRWQESAEDDVTEESLIVEANSAHEAGVIVHKEYGISLRVMEVRRVA